MSRDKGITIEEARGYSRAVYDAVKAGAALPPPPGKKPAPKVPMAERLRMWRDANPEKVKEQRDRAEATRVATRAVKAADRAAKVAVPAGTLCDVCGTVDGVEKDLKRGGALCRDCRAAVGIVWSVYRAEKYRVAIDRYLLRQMLT